MYKDVKLCLEEADAAKVPMPVAAAVRDLSRCTLAEIGAEQDFTTIAQLIERAAGVEIKKR